MALDTLPVGGIAAFAHFDTFDLIGIMAVEAGFGYPLVFIHHLVAGAACSKVGILIGMVVTVLAGGTVLIRRIMGFVVKKDAARHGVVHDPKGLVRWLGGESRITENSHNKQNSCKCVGQLKLFFWCHFRKVLCGWGINATAANPSKNAYHTDPSLSRDFF